MSEDLLLEPGTRLVHIGAPKTGTTSIQEAFADLRRALPDLGVVYPGNARVSKHKDEFDQLFRHGGAAIDRLRAVLAREDERRVVLSTEQLASESPERVAEVRDLVGPRSHVVLTLRNVTEYFASYWQQEIKRGVTDGIGDWTQQRLEQIDDFSIFRRHKGDELITRWVSAFGADAVTVVVLERSAPERLFDVFESMCGLPSGTLVVREQNRGLTWPELELVRSLNERLRDGDVDDAREARRFVLSGIAPGLATGWTPPPGVARPRVPLEHQDAVQEVAHRLADAVRASGVRVVGDLAELSRPAAGVAPPTAPGVPEALLRAALDGLVNRVSAVEYRHRNRRRDSTATSTTL
ncbi:hypothetical protein [Cellulomonas composti]|uniref:Sulfotransferase domain-containing protein n=1 Tax=Cellulomonas composti TaxID=266130 RepID=A0A511JBU9_9CELL|nr:hypothetical protein [Cellulomonas composti]GEL95183.1 hypothetical protein CCO02nite_18410 [Cellulomonas composti]